MKECEICGSTNNVVNYQHSIYLCNKHRKQFIRHGGVFERELKGDVSCEICGSRVQVCKNTKTNKWLCCKHRNQLNNTGNFFKTFRDLNDIVIHDNFAEIILSDVNRIETGRTLIDTEDIELVSNLKWHYNKHTGYVLSDSTEKGLRIHRLILGLSKEDPRVVDHINGNTLDNRKCNLRVCTQMQNSYNTKLNKNNSTGFKGIYFDPLRNSYQVYITHNKIRINLGRYKDLSEAKQVISLAREKYHGEFANHG